MFISADIVDITKIKLIIWDLDNTFWKGILSEGGIESFIPENNELVKALSQRGIVNSICSKNDYEECKEILSGIGLWDYFVFPSIDWTPKGSRIKNIISSMQLRPVNVLFLDDEPYNLQLALESNEGLMCGTAEELVPVLTEQMKSMHVDSSMKRLRQYQELQVKAKAKEDFSSNDEFLRQSEIKVSILTDCLERIDRIAELVARTNQLNFTKKRDSRDELICYIENPAFQCGLISCRDKYSDYGEVGFYVLNIFKHELVHFLFSCRTIGMGIEQWIYAKLGFPDLQAVGTVVTELNDEDCPDWIEFIAADTKKEEDPAKKQFGKILFKGPCDISQVLPYLSNQKAIDSEFAYISTTKGNLYIEAFNHTISVLQSICLTDEQKAFLIGHVPFIDQEYFQTNLFSKEYNVVVFSLLTDYGLGLYQFRDDPAIRIPFGQHSIDYTKKENWMERIGSLKGEMLEQYEYFSTHFYPVGPIGAKELVQNLSLIRTMLPQDTQLLLLNGSEIEYPGECKFWLVGREKEHKVMNEAVREATAQLENCHIIEINSILDSPDLYLDTINHYKKSVYFSIAQEIQKYLEQNGISRITAKSKARLALENFAGELKKNLKKWIRH